MITSKIKLILLLLFPALACISGALFIYCCCGEDISNMWSEIAKALMNLGAVVIIGGFVKILLDLVREENRKEGKKKDFKKDLRDRLRSVFDQVELSRTLIQSHKSAKTYGERIRNAIMPGVVTLFDVERDLLHSKDMIAKNVLEHLRVSINYMIAYLTSLTEEYEQEYGNISHKQSYQEEIRKLLKNRYATKVVDNIAAKKYDDKQSKFKSEIKDLCEEELTKMAKVCIPDQVQMVWTDISKLKELSGFLKNEKNIYADKFLSYYEYCKYLLYNDEEIKEEFQPAILDTTLIENLNANRNADPNEKTKDDKRSDNSAIE